MERSLLLRVQVLRANANWVRAKALLSEATTATGNRGQLLDQAGRYARRLERESAEFPRVWALMVRAAIAVQRADQARAARLLRDAAAVATKYELGFVAAAARHRLGTLVGGDEGAAASARADEWMTREGIVNPDRMLEVAAPGFGPPASTEGGAP
jgi:hypothetical protein